MLDLLINLGMAAGGAILAGLAANEATKVITGKSIPEHIYNWWCQLREKICAWIGTYPQYAPYTRFVIARIDSYLCRVFALLLTEKEELYVSEVSEETISIEDFQLQQGQCMEIPLEEIYGT